MPRCSPQSFLSSPSDNWAGKEHYGGMVTPRGVHVCVKEKERENYCGAEEAQLCGSRFSSTIYAEVSLH